MRMLAAFTGIMSLIVSTTTISHAQQLADSDRAVLAFDVAVSRLLTSDMMKKAQFDPATMAGNSPINPADLVRVFGAVSAPKSMADLQQPNPEKLPVSMFVRVKFKSPELATKAYTEMSNTGGKVTKGGKEYMTPPEGGPQDMLGHMYAPDTIELGSENYIVGGIKNPFTANLLEAWKKAPEQTSVKIVLDLNGARNLINEAKQNAPPESMMVTSLLDNSSAIRLALDFSSDKLLWLTMTGADAAKTGTLKAQMDGLMTMASGFGQQALGQIPMPNLKKSAGQLLRALKTTQDGNDVNIVLPKPEGFEDAIGELGQLIPMMMMQGAGGPPPGNAFS